MYNCISITHNIPYIKRLLKQGDFEDALVIIDSMLESSISIKKEIEINFLAAICYTDMFDKAKAFQYIESSYNLNSTTSFLVLLNMEKKLNYKSSNRNEQLYNRLFHKISSWFMYYTI